MTAWTNEVMTVPIDAYTGVGEPLITAIKGDVIVNFAFVFFCVELGASHSCFFVNREEKNQIAFGFDLSRVERPD